MENNVKEELNICQESTRQRDMIMNSLGLSEKILQVLRGVIPQDECDVKSENCVLDTIKINTSNLISLERNLNEIIRKITGQENKYER